MNEILSAVTPGIQCIIWTPAAPLQPSSPTYRAIDYLLNGLLTATLNVQTLGESQVLVGQNFGHPLIIYIHRAPTKKALEDLLGLLKKPQTEEADVLLMGALDGEIPKALKSRIRVSPLLNKVT